MGESTVFIFLLSICILVTIGCYSLKKKLKIPIAPLLLAVGVLLRILGGLLENLKLAVEEVDHIDPDLLLQLVMPLLIFGASLEADWYTFKRRFLQYFFLGTTAVVANSLLLALVLKYILMYDFEWGSVWLIGVVLSSNDHVAIGSLMKEIKANKKFSTILERETSIGDPMILMLFHLLIKNLDSEAVLEESFVLFLRLVSGGLAMGLCFCVPLGYVLYKTTNDHYTEISITLAASYLLFYVCEGFGLEFNGGVAVLTLGLFVSAYGVTLFSYKVKEKLELFWGILQKNTENVVFLITGMLIGMEIQDSSHISWGDFGKLFGLFFFIHIARALTMLLHFPLLKWGAKNAFKVNFKQLFAMSITVLKGPITVVLSLIVYHSDRGTSEQFRALVLFLAFGVTALTICLDTHLIKFVFRKLGFEGLSGIQEKIMLEVTDSLMDHTDTQIATLRASKQFPSADWNYVTSLVGSSKLLEETLKKARFGKTILRVHPNVSPENYLQVLDSQFRFSASEVVVEKRRRFFVTLKAVYWETFSKGQCSGSTYVMLRKIANLCLDSTHKKMQDWKLLEHELNNSLLIKVFETFSNLSVFKALCKRIIFYYMRRAYDAAGTFCKCHRETIRILEELEGAGEALELVAAEARLQVTSGTKFIKEFVVDSYPEVVSEIQCYQASKAVLVSQRELIQEIFEQGAIEALEYENLMNFVDQTWKSIKPRRSSKDPSLQEVLKSRFKNSPDTEIKFLCENIKFVSFEQNQVLFEEGQETNCAYLIFKGRVQEESNWMFQELEVGSIVGVQHLLPEFSCTVTSAKAVTSVSAAVLTKPVVLEYLNILKCIYLEASEEILMYNQEALNLGNLTKDCIRKVVAESTLKLFKEQDKFSLNSGGFILSGELLVGVAPSFFYPSDETFTVSSEYCVVLEFPFQLGAEIVSSSNCPEGISSYYKKQLTTKFKWQKTKTQPKSPNLTEDPNVTQRSIYS